MMNPTVDELLSLLLSCVEFLTHPTAQLQQTLRSWDREHPWRLRIRRLQRRGYIKPTPASTHFPYLVTRAGSQRALGAVNPEDMVEARCYPGFTDDQIVKAAWNFDVINDHYRFYLDLCETRLAEFLSRDPDPRNAIALLRQERSAWSQATRFDPLLPRCLWPVGYLGPTAWDARRHLLGI
jgi:hypothetical protein